MASDNSPEPIPEDVTPPAINGELNDEELGEVSGGTADGLNYLIQVAQVKADTANQSSLSSSQAQAKEQQLKNQQLLNAKLSLPL